MRSGPGSTGAAVAGRLTSDMPVALLIVDLLGPRGSSADCTALVSTGAGDLEGAWMEYGWNWMGFIGTNTDDESSCV